MASGPIFPFSAVPDNSGNIYPIVYDGAGAGGSDLEEGLGLTDATTLDADAVWHLRFQFPQSLPIGTCKLRLIALANATTGNVMVNPKWASVAANEDPSVASLNAETATTVSFTAADDYKETKITLDADTPVAGEICVMALTFEDTSTTLAVESCWHPSIIWE